MALAGIMQWAFIAGAIHTVLLLQPDPIRTIPISTTVVFVVVVLPRGEALPDVLTHRISYSLPLGVRANALIGSQIVNGPEIRVDKEPPI
jgi:hypothetical protein